MCVYTSLEQTLIIAHKEEIHPSTTECSSPCYFTTARRHYSQSLRSIVPLCRYLMHFKSRVLHFDMMKYTTNFAMNARRLGNVILFIFHLFLYTCILYLSFIMCADGNRCMQNNNNNRSSSRIYAWFNESSKWWRGGSNVRLCTHRAITVSELRGADIFLFDSLAGWTIQGIRISAPLRIKCDNEAAKIHTSVKVILEAMSKVQSPFHDYIRTIRLHCLSLTYSFIIIIVFQRAD